MGDRTNLQVFIYKCPEDQCEAAATLLGDMDIDWGSVPHVPGTLTLSHPYTRYETSCGTADSLAAELREAAPGASFVLWEDPAYEWLGSIQAYTPELGAFGAECTEGGEVVFTFAQVADVIAASPTARSAVRAQLRKAMGGPWLDDWHAHINAGNVPADPQ